MKKVLVAGTLFVGALAIGYTLGIRNAPRDEPLAQPPPLNRDATTDSRESDIEGLINSEPRENVENQQDRAVATAPLPRYNQFSLEWYERASRTTIEETIAAFKELDRGSLEREAALAGIISSWVEIHGPSKSFALTENNFPSSIQSSLFALGQAIAPGSRGSSGINSIASQINSASEFAEWDEHFENHAYRHPLIKAVAERLAREERVDTIESIAASLQPGVQDTFINSSLHTLVSAAPLRALELLNNQINNIPGDVRQAVIKDVFGSRRSSLSRSKIESALNHLSDRDERENALAMAATSLTHRGTISAIEWAKGLRNSKDVDTALHAIAEATPTGIGARVRPDKNGIAIDSLVANGSAMTSGALSIGDVITAVDSGDGTFVDVANLPLSDAIKLIRGTPGSNVRLKIRHNNDSGDPAENEIVLARDPILFAEEDDG